MKIINNTNLSYAELGLIIDKVIEESCGNTIYYGKVEIATVEFKGHIINIQIRYLKKYVEWRFSEKNE